MKRTFLLILFFLPVMVKAQQFLSDNGTPIVPPQPCDCDTWSTIVKKVDSSTSLLYTVTFEKNGQKYKRTYYVTRYDSSLYDICDKPANCKNARRERNVKSEREWFVDVPECKFISFTLPCCSDKKIDVKAVGQLKFNGKCTFKYNPETLDIPALIWSEVKTASVTASDGTTLNASIEMVNKDIKVTGKVDAILTKLNKINDFATKTMKPVIDKANNLLNTYLSKIGEWESKVSVTFGIGGEMYLICCPTKVPCVENSYKVSGDGKIGLEGKVGIPLAGVPVIGRFLGAINAVVKLGVSLGISVNAKTTCDNFAVCVNPEGKVTGGGGFSATVAGFKGEGVISVEEGGISGEICVLPDFEVKCVKFTTGKLKLTGSVEDRWGWTKWTVEYVIWNGATWPLKGCN